MSFPRRLARGITIGLVALIVAGCESDDGGTTVDPNAPVIANLVGAFGAACTTASGAGRGRRLTVNFADADGNVSGGRATVETAFGGGVGNAFIVDIPIPSAAASISGTTAGTVTLLGCVTFGATSTITESVTVTDASGKTSNVLSVTTTRPAGFPQAPKPVPAPTRSVPNGG